MREFSRGVRTPFLPILCWDDLTDEPAFLALRRESRFASLLFPGRMPASGSEIRKKCAHFLERLEEGTLLKKPEHPFRFCHGFLSHADRKSIRHDDR